MRVAWLGAVLLCASACGDDETAAGASGGGGAALIGDDQIPETSLENAQLGDPELRSAQRIAFGPGGMLLVADGARDRLVAIETGEGGFGVAPAPERLDGLRGAIASLYGEGALPTEIVVQDIAVEPLSRRIYLAAERYATGLAEPLVAVVGEDGKLRRLSFESVIWAEVPLPPNETAGTYVTSLAWQGDRVVTSAGDGAFAAPTLFMKDTPLRHGSFALAAVPSTYLPATGQIHFDLPIMAATTYGDELTSWALMAFIGAPVSRFDLRDTPIGTARGETVFDLGPGREARGLVAADDGDRLWLWMTVYNAAFDGQILGYRVGGGLATGAFGTEFFAPLVIDTIGFPTHPDVVVEPVLNGALRLALRTPSSVVALREDSLAVHEFE